MKRTLAEIAGIIGCDVIGDGNLQIVGVSGIKEAGPGHLTFLSNPRYEKFVSETKASAIVVSREFADGDRGCGPALVVSDNPYRAFAEAMALFAPEGDGVGPGVHETAVVAESARMGEGVAIGASAVVMEGARLGDGVVIHPGTYVGTSVVIGAESVLYPNVTVRHGSIIGERVLVHSGTVIGSDGFGFARDGDSNQKVPQIGNVVIEDDVEIGANVCIDRATLGSTRVCRGSKIDNLVQIAHNVVVGEGSIVVAQVGISGSTHVGKGVVLGGQAGLVGHIEIGDGAMVGAQAGVIGSIPAGERVSGYPARKHSVAKRLYALVEHLPKLVARLRDLEGRLARLESSASAEEAERRPDKEG